MTCWSRWPPDPGAATKSLRRSLHVVMLVLVLFGGLLLLLGGTAAGGTSLELQVAAVAFVAPAIVATTLWGEFGLGQAAVLGACSIWSATLPASGHVPTGAALLSAAFLMTCTGSYRPPAAFILCLFGVAGFLGASALRTGGFDSVAVDQTVINLAIGFSASGFLGVAREAALRRDRVATERADVELGLRVQAMREESEQAARRVLHDEVLTALRAVDELPGSGAQTVRAACRDAVVAVGSAGAYG